MNGTPSRGRSTLARFTTARLGADGGGGSTGVTTRSVLSSGVGSGWSESTTAVLATLVPTGRSAGTRATIVTCAEAPDAIVPSAQETVPPASEQAPWLGVAETNVRPGEADPRA